MSQEPLWMGRPRGNIPSAVYSPVMIGQSDGASCPARSYWWLVVAAGLGGLAGWKYSEGKRRGRRR